MKPLRAPDIMQTVDQPDAAPGILTIPEAARELRCSKAHVLNLIKGKVRGARPLPSVWMGRRRVVRRSTLDSWIRANEHF